MTIAIHATHEALHKIGGIGTVLHGLLTARSYLNKFERSLLYTPLFNTDGRPSDRLGDDSEILYSGLDGIDAGNFKNSLSKIEAKYGIRVAYGKKLITKENSTVERSKVDILGVDIWNMNPKAIDEFKFRLWETFKIQSNRYRHDTDYEQYLRIAIPLRDLVEALYGKEKRAVLFSHEYMGMPSALAFELDRRDGRRKADTTVFYAHEVSTARSIVEHHPGHDFAFYNIMKIDRDEGVSLEQEFGSQIHYSRNELVKLATNLDFIFAVSDITKEEYLYLRPDADESKIKVVYNGIPVKDVPYSQKKRSFSILRDYCENLFNFRPDHVFTHVARLVISKGMWRDTRLLYHLDEHFARHRLKGFFVLLSTLVGGGRSKGDIATMEAGYGWPVLHREGWPDLIGQESEMYHQLEIFNSRSRAIKGVFINQFGFSRERCGERMPADSSFFDLRLASDIEFGLSIYEPFGIAQLETLPYGGFPLVTKACGCYSLLERTLDPKDYLLIDSTRVPENLSELFRSKSDFRKMTKEIRDTIETEMCRGNVQMIIDSLPRTEKDRQLRFKRMQERSRLLDWEHIAAGVVSHL